MQAQCALFKESKKAAAPSEDSEVHTEKTQQNYGWLLDKQSIWKSLWWERRSRNGFFGGWCLGTLHTTNCSPQ